MERVEVSAVEVELDAKLCEIFTTSFALVSSRLFTDLCEVENCVEDDEAEEKAGWADAEDGEPAALNGAPAEDSIFSWESPSNSIYLI